MIGELTIESTTIFLADFEDGDDGFVVEDFGNGLWHRSEGRGNQPGHSPTFSFYYGQGEGPNGGGNYNVGSNSAHWFHPLSIFRMIPR